MVGAYYSLCSNHGLLINGNGPIKQRQRAGPYVVVGADLEVRNDLLLELAEAAAARDLGGVRDCERGREEEEGGVEGGR